MQRGVFTTVSGDELRRIQNLHEPVAKLERKEVLTIQLAKLLNYWRDDIDPTWGGGKDERDFRCAEKGVLRFLKDTDACGDPNLPLWLRKKSDDQPWGPDNFKLSGSADPNLGYPYEAYLTVNGGILTMAQASRLLCIDMMTLVRVKCTLLIDERVVAYAVTEMLRPRPLWPRIRLKPGGKGRSYRFD